MIGWMVFRIRLCMAPRVGLLWAPSLARASSTGAVRKAPADRNAMRRVNLKNVLNMVFDCSCSCPTQSPSDGRVQETRVIASFKRRVTSRPVCSVRRSADVRSTFLDARDEGRGARFYRRQHEKTGGRFHRAASSSSQKLTDSGAEAASPSGKRSCQTQSRRTRKSYESE